LAEYASEREVEDALEDNAADVGAAQNVSDIEQGS
jgi:hypothetical protein